MKKFKSVHPEKSYMCLIVGEDSGRVQLSVDHGSNGVRGIQIAPSDAPALCLAILEAAGVETNESMHYGQLGSDDHLGKIKYDLMRYIEHRDARAAAEADRVKLEAEALELRKAWKQGDGFREDKFSDLIEVAQDKWLAVARKAREINKEAGQ